MKKFSTLNNLSSTFRDYEIREMSSLRKFEEQESSRRPAFQSPQKFNSEDMFIEELNCEQN